jgi:hypothetical protein
MIEIRIRDNQNTLWKTIDFILLDGSNKILNYPISQELIIDIFSNNCKTAFQARLQQERIQKFIDYLINFVYRDFNITEDFYQKNLLLPQLKHTLFKLKKINLPRYTHTFKEQKVSKIPEEVQKALEISEKALKYEKDIRNKIKEIEKDKQEYFKKYWTLSQNTETYLQNKFKKWELRQ